MKYRFITASLVVAVAAGLLCAILFGAPQQGGADRAARIKDAASKPTPRATDGHPDLSGYWGEPQRTVGVENAAESSNEDMAHTFRIVPIGGQHNKDRDAVPDGDSIAFWYGDTLVVDVVNIDPETWLDGDGTFHDEN